MTSAPCKATSRQAAACVVGTGALRWTHPSPARKPIVYVTSPFADVARADVVVLLLAHRYGYRS
jgi:hypothetical protein